MLLHELYSKVPLCMVDLAQTIEEWKDLCSVKVDDQVNITIYSLVNNQKTVCLLVVFGRHLFLVAVCANFGQTDRWYFGM